MIAYWQCWGLLITLLVGCSTRGRPALGDAGELVFYHATKYSNKDSILKNGLDPSRGGSGSSMGIDVAEQHSADKVHVTESLATALWYARFNYCRDKEPTMIFKVVLDNSFSTLRDDPDDMRSALTVAQNVSPERLKVVRDKLTFSDSECSDMSRYKQESPEEGSTMEPEDGQVDQ